MKYIARLLTALATISAGAGYAQTLFPILESDVDASGTVLMCPKSNIYVPCRDTGSLLLPVALNLFPPRHRETPEANADASGAAQANASALGTVLMCPSRGGTYARCADAGALPPSVEVGRVPKLFAQVTTPYHARYGRRHYRQAGPKLFAQVTRAVRDMGDVIIVTFIAMCGKAVSGISDQSDGAKSIGNRL